MNEKYKKTARNLGNEKLAMAVGLANYKSPLFFLIPCHRVIGSNGDLVGYGNGREEKAYRNRKKKCSIIINNKYNI